MLVKVLQLSFKLLLSSSNQFNSLVQIIELVLIPLTVRVSNNNSSSTINNKC